MRALTGVSVDFFPGKVHVLVGENGAGKSTLIKMMSGIYKIDSGRILNKGSEIRYSSPRQALDEGIVVIPQELSVVPSLTVAENIFLGHEIRRGAFIDRARTREEAGRLLERLDVNISPDAVVSELSTAQMQMIEIARSISREASVIIMDEPTASLSDREVATLFRTIKKLKSAGVAIIYISHRLEELFTIGDTVTVLRDGRLIRTMDMSGLDVNSLVVLMVGREVKDFFHKGHHATDEAVLEVEDFSCDGVPHGVTFQLKKGEILGISGLVGAGRSELLHGLIGANRRLGGRVRLRGREVFFRRPGDAIKERIGIIPEERKTQGIIIEDDVKSNISLPNLVRTARFGFLNRLWERSAALEYVGKLKVKTPSIDTVTKNLSGGNQQKVVIAKWLAGESDILFVDEVTRGIDVNAKAEIYLLLNQFTENGGSVLMVSSELPELLGVCDR
ncbi:MAG: sugar ABC transporter ATP-binding protein, partial [Synergistaceae bacterium]|nr:sugar ABC transporter ATP-binding protein [Synergistaceae bacterium]